MESIYEYFAANPAIITLATLFIVLFILYCILKRLVKFALVLVFIFLLFFGTYLFKDPATAPDRLKVAVDTIKAGGSQIAEKTGDFLSDTRDLFGRAKKVPGEINRLLDPSNN